MRDGDAFRLARRAGREEDFRCVVERGGLESVQADPLPCERMLRMGQTGQGRAAGGIRPSPIISARASTIAAIRSTTFADDRKSMGTAITPSSRQPHRATIHSGRFSHQNRTRSPRLMPAVRSCDAKPEAADAVAA